MPTVKKSKADTKSVKAPKEGEKKETIISYVTELLEDDSSMSTQDMITKVKKKFPESAFSKSHVAYYRNKLRKAGMDIPLLREVEKEEEEPQPKAKTKKSKK